MPTLTDLPGKQGSVLEAYAEKAIDFGRAALEYLVESALRRMLRFGASGVVTTWRLFNNEEIHRLVQVLAATVGTAELLGRSDVRQKWVTTLAANGELPRVSEAATLRLNRMFGAWLSEKTKTLAPDPMLPEAAIDYFRGLTPALGVDPQRFGDDLRRRVFTMAVATDQTLLGRVQGIITERMQTGAFTGGPQEIQDFLNLAGVTPANPQYACFLPGTLVEGDVLAASRAKYSGPAVEIETDDRRRLRVTVNHPVLTTAGWKHAGEIQEGENLVCYGDSIESFPARFAKRRAVYNQDVPASVEDVFESFFAECGSRLYAERPVTSLDFHGDAAFFEGKVSCVGADGMLEGSFDSDSGELCGEIGFMLGDVATAKASSHRQRLLYLGRFRKSIPVFSPSGLGNGDCFFDAGGSRSRRQSQPVESMRVSAAAQLDAGCFHAADKDAASDVQFNGKLIDAFAGLVSANCIRQVERVALAASSASANDLYPCGSGSRTKLRPVTSKRIGSAANLDPSRFKATDKSRRGDAKLSRNLLRGLPGFVSLRRVAKIKRFTWTGHIYDLQSRTGFVVSQGIISSNSMVFRTNVIDSYNQAADEERREPEIQDTFPVWQYSNPDDSRSRPEHAARDGRYYPAAVPFVSVRGESIEDAVNCRCVPIAVSKWQWAKLKASGARIADGFPDVPSMNERPAVQPVAQPRPEPLAPEQPANAPIVLPAPPSVAQAVPSLRQLADNFRSLGYGAIEPAVRDVLGNLSAADAVAAAQEFGITTARSRADAIRQVTAQISDLKASFDRTAEIGATPLPQQPQTQLPFDLKKRPLPERLFAPPASGVSRSVVPGLMTGDAPPALAVPAAELNRLFKAILDDPDADEESLIASVHAIFNPLTKDDALALAGLFRRASPTTKKAAADSVANLLRNMTAIQF